MRPTLSPHFRLLIVICSLSLVTLAGCNGGSKKAVETPPLIPTTGSQSGATPFVDISKKAGLDFVQGHGGRSPLTILETLGCGGGIFDFDGDGWQDIILAAPDKVALYHNNKNATFTDVTAQSGLETKGTWQGVATGDYDNDGKVDLYISGYRTCALYHNEGNGKFKNVTVQARLTSKLWGTSAAFVDVDNDGSLDLVVANYVKFYPNSVKFCKQANVQATCGPTTYDPEKPVLYHNNKNGTFTDETNKRGLDTAHGNTLGIAIADYDHDGWIDLAIANDQQPGDLFRNKGKGYFENVAGTSGTSYDVNGNAHAGMGIDWADINASQKLSLIVTTYQHQPTSLYMQLAPGLFTDECFTTGIGQPTTNYVGFGAKFFDYDNDGWVDLIEANGHAVDNIGVTDNTTSYAQPAQLFHNKGQGKFEEADTGPEFKRGIVGRGVAVGDIDNDGKQDILIIDIEGNVLLFHNQTSTSNHWLSLQLVGSKSNRDGIGAELTIESGNKKWVQVVSSTGSLMSAHDKRAHIGLGTATKADKIVIRWSGGTKTELTNVQADQFLEVDEATGNAKPTH